MTPTEALNEALTAIAIEIDRLKDRQSGFDHGPRIQRLREATAVLNQLHASQHEAYQ